jgi:hypothetical protein
LRLGFVNRLDDNARQAISDFGMDEVSNPVMHGIEAHDSSPSCNCGIGLQIDVLHCGKDV